MAEWMPAWMSRFLGVESSPREFQVARIEAAPVEPGYPTKNSMSAMGAFPYVRACVVALSTDLSGLPLQALDEPTAGERRVIPDEPALKALRQPNEYITGRRLRRQLVGDFCLAGNAYLWRNIRDGGPAHLAPLVRLHPTHTKLYADDFGLPAYAVFNEKQTISMSELLHVADISWSDDLSQIYGASAIQALHEDLTTLLASKRLTSRTAQRGRPDLAIAPADPKSGLGAGGPTKLKAKIKKSFDDGDPALVFSEAVALTPFSWSPRDLEFVEQNKDTVYAILACFGVPPVRIGLEAANYGTARTQMRMYWESLRQNHAALFDDEFSRLTSDPRRIRIEHDFSSVEALQVSYNDRLDRVGKWVALGMDPNAAAKLEGFINAPPMAGPAGDAGPAVNDSRRPEEPQDERRALLEDLRQYLRGASDRYTEAHRARQPLDALRGIEALRLARVLDRHVHDDERALSVARLVADQCAEAADDFVTRSAMDGTEPVSLGGLLAFSELRARQLAASLGAA